MALGTLTVATEQASRDGTVKRLYRLHDGHLIESVLMKYTDGRRTACISSQAGCAMGCVFCATGQMGFGRHLTPTEIFEQVWRYDRALKADGERLSNVVLMGMGEPFHNYTSVVTAMRRMNQDLGIGARHITVSTVGIVPKIKELATEGIQVTLAVSLHAATDAARSVLMPVNRKWSVEDLVRACRDYVDQTHRRVTFEWALIEGQTDTVEEAHRLGHLLSGLLCHVNLIPLNPTGGYGGRPSAPERVKRFVRTLGRHGVPASVRVRRGIDIDAGCGQLRSRVVEEQGLRP
jgi:23S rRNA (adenine2503-C2)-methyltransferase